MIIWLVNKLIKYFSGAKVVNLQINSVQLFKNSKFAKILIMQKVILPFLIVILFLIQDSPAIAQNKSMGKSESKSDKIKWYSFEEAYQLNKKKQKKIFIDVYTEWCGWCKKMDAETFANPLIAKYMSEHFYCVKLGGKIYIATEVLVRTGFFNRRR